MGEKRFMNKNGSQKISIGRSWKILDLIYQSNRGMCRERTVICK